MTTTFNKTFFSPARHIVSIIQLPQLFTAGFHKFLSEYHTPSPLTERAVVVLVVIVLAVTGGGVVIFSSYGGGGVIYCCV